MATNSGWAALGGLIGGAFRGGRDTNEGGSVFGGKRTLLKDALEGGGAAQDDQFADAAKKAKSLRTLFKLYGAEMGQPQLADHAETLSLGELEGGLKAYVLKQDADERKQKQDYQKRVMAQMDNVEAERKRDASATEAFSRYATQPAAQEQWGGALAGGPTMAGAATLEQPLRAPTGPETASAFVRAMRTGGMPDARAVSALSRLAPEGQARDFVPRPFSVNGMDGIFSPETGAIHVKPTPSERAGGATAKATVDPFDRMDYAELNRTLSDLEKEYLKTTSVDARSELVGSMNRIKKTMQRIRGGGQAAPAAAPAAAPQAAAPTMRFGLVNGQLMPIK